MSINAGRLKKHIEIWRYQSTVNAAGSDVNHLVKVHTVYGEIRPVRGSEYTEYYKEQHELIYKITIRFWPDLRPTDVLQYHGRQYEIRSIINPEQADYIFEIMCVEQDDKHKRETPITPPTPTPPTSNTDPGTTETPGTDPEVTPGTDPDPEEETDPEVTP